MEITTVTSLRKPLKVLQLQSIVAKEEGFNSNGVTRLIRIRHKMKFLKSSQKNETYNLVNDFKMGIRDVMDIGDIFKQRIKQEPDGSYTDEHLDKYTKLENNSLFMSVSFLGEDYCFDLSKAFKDTLGLTFKRINRNYTNIHIASLLGISWGISENKESIIRLAFSSRVGKEGKKEDYIQYTYLYFIIGKDKKVRANYYKVYKNEDYRNKNQVNFSDKLGDFKSYMGVSKGQEEYVILTKYNNELIDIDAWYNLESQIKYYKTKMR